ncbi:putative quinol monooxygenase [Microbulbifer sp. SSSA002]|uniref:putative quinol monooxygenase n=1 Tax=unclassified Microbulbifer TaxID=2619833 RepID=UPI0040390E3C
MFKNIGWIVEVKIKKGQEQAFRAIVDEMVEITSQQEAGTLNYQYYISDNREIIVYEHFSDVSAAHKHVDTWEKYSERWLKTAEPTRVIYLGEIPDDLRARHKGLMPQQYYFYAGFERNHS